MTYLPLRGKANRFMVPLLKANVKPFAGNLPKRYPGAVSKFRLGVQLEMSQNKKAGFTLIEVLIVVVILAVLAATVIPQFTDSTTDAKKSSVMLNLHTLRSQIQLYRVQHEGKAPSANLNELTIATDVDGTAGGSFGPYITKIPVNSFTNSNSVKALTAAPAPSDFNDTDGWLYNTNTGDIWINYEDLKDE